MSDRWRAGGVRPERGKHGEATGFASWRNKGESEARGTSSVSEGELFKEFFTYGIIIDVFVSRKQRRNGRGLLAFIRFKEYGSARRAIERMNGVWWSGRKMHRKEVVLSRSKFQSKILARSVLGVNVKPIDFGFVENTLLREWTGPGIIECRDVGPFRCLITFETEKIKEEAIEDQLLASVFDEVRHHWDVVWSLSRRVWIEVMGLPTFAWSEENLRSIANLWGKFVYADDRTEKSWSYSVASVGIFAV
ncbi:hypothetical protein PIB30_043774 [Stylosanthes scabra]|uniref:RRM domain-containing protein n=1 Tax=Stylosanthes scabra TaxID=79078 RepID=A0ABU6QF15_9FABA|nr:hypothetical protein [Stylosanthes scabra]